MPKKDKIYTTEIWAKNLRNDRLVFFLFYNKPNHSSKRKITAGERKILLKEFKQRHGISFNYYLKELAEHGAY